MSSSRRGWRVLAGGVAVALIAATPTFAQQKEVTIGYQDMVVPYRIAQDAKEIEAATGYKINWKQFGGGGEVIKAMASGAVQIGEVGSADDPLEIAIGDERFTASLPWLDRLYYETIPDIMTKSTAALVSAATESPV